MAATDGSPRAHEEPARDVDADRLDTILRQYDAFGRVAHIGCFEWDLATNVVTWTDELFRIYGQEPQSFQPTFETFLAQIHPDDRDLVQDSVNDALRRRGDFVMTERVIRPDGETRYLDTWGEVVVGDDGEPVRLIGVCEDMTTQRLQEQAIAVAREDLLKYQALIEASTDFIGIASLGGDVLYINPAGRRLIGLPEDTDVSGTVIADYLDEEGLRRSEEIEQKTVFSEGSYEGESWLTHQETGERIPMWVSTFLVKHPDSGTPMAEGTVQRDLRVQKAAEARLARLDAERQQLLAHLVEAQEAERQRIAGDVHDDTIQVMTAADLRLGLVGHAIADAHPDERAQIEEVRRAVREATARLRNLVFPFESPADDQPLPRALDECARRVLDNTSFTWTLDVPADLDLPRTTRIVAYRIAHEALCNALYHSGGRNVAVRAYAADNGVELTVADDGVGVDPETVASPVGHFGLTGMRERAAIAGGWWRIECGPDGGTVVRFWLPADR